MILVTATPYGFREQLKKGEHHEAALDAHFASLYEIMPVSIELQRLGIDRRFEDKQTHAQWLVQYKADETAAKTHNAFIETVSVDTEDIPGWIYTCCAQILVYYVPPLGKVYILSVPKLKWAAREWIREYEPRPAPNDTYTTWGICPPLTELESIAKTVIVIDGMGAK